MSLNLIQAIEENGAQITSDPLPTVRAYGAHCVQVFQNLIGNALKFRRDAPIRVHVSAERKENEWVFSVRDNGIGLEPGSQERVFDLFYRCHPKDKYPIITDPTRRRRLDIPPVLGPVDESAHDDAALLARRHEAVTAIL